MWMRKRSSNQQGSEDQSNAYLFFPSSLKTLGLAIIWEFWQNFNKVFFFFLALWIMKMGGIYRENG